jgi:hypothetical protein
MAYETLAINTVNYGDVNSKKIILDTIIRVVKRRLFEKGVLGPRSGGKILKHESRFAS